MTNTLESALLRISRFLEAQATPYMVIGGFANLQWGEPRLTRDLDLTVQVAEEGWPDFIAAVGAEFELLSDDPLTFVRANGALPIAMHGGIRIDLIFESHPMVARAIARAKHINVAGRLVRFCTPEDLILHKLVAGRPRDQADVEGVIVRQAENLDRSYLDPLVSEISTDLDRPDISQWYDACLKKARLSQSRHRLSE